MCSMHCTEASSSSAPHADLLLLFQCYFLAAVRCGSAKCEFIRIQFEILRLTRWSEECVLWF
jgi:hypothetical protein